MRNADIPNLDAMSVQELRDFARWTRTLADYATMKANAMQWRADGVILSALEAERKADSLYEKLPTAWRW